eukprot:CAMPEP_0183728514 /NCGR_PEP_ID=MMETSP0737-20130205/28243_1 /TAXON_ID=385413 /ORGANISM="Thalassiosira miniscula, Strain CCMP1093" /LENGTH=473 /DNA_ID=CAMNT_0025960475 /DNA_START=110 /DNA_END=1527 /DNA_ORIENTATION=-
MGGGKRNRHNHSGSNRGGSNKHKHNQQNNNNDDYNTSSSSRTNRQDQRSSSSSSEPDDEDLDFCQRFFGDPLFSNLNVSLLFLTATFLPMIVWIPHFLSEYRRLRHIQYLEEERQMRMQKARMEVKSSQQQQQHQQQQQQQHQQQHQQQQHSAGDSETDPDITILQDSIGTFNSKSTIHFPDPHPLNSHVPNGEGGYYSNNNNNHQGAQATILPTLCPDGVTIGYDNWFLLRDAISEANAIAAEEFLRWNEYLVKAAKNRSTEPPVYHPPEPFVICPGVTLNSKSPYRSIFSPYYWASYIVSFLPYTSSSSSTQSKIASGHQPLVPSRRSSTAPKPKSKNKLSPIFINAEDITIECDMCTVDLPGTHFSFGPHAKNVLIKGITFRGATTSSLTFHHHGADVGLEDCYWLYNSGGMVNNNRNGGPYANVNGNEGLMSTPPGSTTTAGAVADLNSTSTVTFYRCVIDDVKQNPKR